MKHVCFCREYAEVEKDGIRAAISCQDQSKIKRLCVLIRRSKNSMAKATNARYQVSRDGNPARDYTVHLAGRKCGSVEGCTRFVRSGAHKGSRVTRLHTIRQYTLIRCTYTHTRTRSFVVERKCIRAFRKRLPRSRS